jgi:hypothetical protein
MQFNFTRQNLTAGERRLQRFLEILPGLTSWSILLGVTALSITNPLVAAIVIIAFHLFWFFRLLYMTLFLGLSYFRLLSEKDTDWMKRIQDIDHLRESSKKIRYEGKRDLGKWISFFVYKQELKKLGKSGNPPPLSRDIYHLVIFPIIKESRDVVEPGIKSLSEQDFPAERILVVFALEERADAKIKDSVLALEKKYKDHFLDTLVIVHPSDLPGEARVKGANVTFAAKHAAEYFKKKEVLFANVVVSCFDADTIVGPEYFPCLTYHFMVTPSRIQCSFQPVPVYHNNIWQVPGFARVIETGSSFFQLIEATNPKKLVTFSSHSMSFQALVEVEYWPVDMISDDSAIYWKSLIHYDGRYSVIPMYVTLSMDVVGADTFWQTARNVYKQKRRWAWGVENFPIVMRAFLKSGKSDKSGKSGKIPFYDKFRYIFKLFEGHISWATWGFLLAFIGWFPIIFARGEFTSSVMYYNAPRITQTIFNLALLSLLISIILSISLLPKTDIRHPLRKKIGHALEWLLIPVILLIFSALPSLDAQTRLMFGRYMEFWVADKTRKK